MSLPLERSLAAWPRSKKSRSLPQSSHDRPPLQPAVVCPPSLNASAAIREARASKPDNFPLLSPAVSHDDTVCVTGFTLPSHLTL